MSLVRDLTVLLTCVFLLIVGSAIYVRQVAEQTVVLDALTRLKTAEATLESQRIVINALAVGQRSNGEADARLFATVQALQQAIRENANRDRYRFALTSAAMGAGR